MTTYSLDGHNLSFDDLLPREAMEHALPGARNSYCTADFGSIMLSELSCPLFDVISARYTIRQKKCLLAFTSDTAAISLQVSWQNGLFIKAGSLPETLLLQGQYQLSYTPHREGQLFFARPGTFHQFCFRFTPVFLDLFAPFYPTVSQLLDAAAKGLEMAFDPMPEDMAPAMSAVLWRLASPDMEEAAVRDALVYCQVQELVLLALEKLTAPGHVSLTTAITPGDREKIQAAGEYLLEHLAEYKSIKKLSRKVGLNVNKLGTGFREVFGEGVCQFVIKARLAKSQELLLTTTKDVYVISEEVGYSHPGAFFSLFKRITGLTPGGYREKKSMPDAAPIS